MSKIVKIAEAKLPTVFGEFKIVGFRDTSTDKEHIALVMGDMEDKSPVLARIHSECLTGDTLFSLKCDCGFQLEEALKMISAKKRGVLLYVRQEGRGIGLLNKIRAYALQDQGLDTYDANVALGFKPDERNYDICAEMFKLLGVKEVRLITNNPDKLNALRGYGIEIAGREPIEVGRNKYNNGYLETKKARFHHFLSEMDTHGRDS
jgi:GTP cyclohydrolase II